MLFSRMAVLLALVVFLTEVTYAQDATSFGGTPSNVGAADEYAADLANRLAGRYQKIGALRSRFVQVAVSEFLDQPERFSGMLTVEEEKYRIQTSTQTIVTDGTTTWIHNRSEAQVLINDFVEDESSFSLTSFLRQFDREYHARFDGKEYRQGAAYEKLYLTPIDDFAAFRNVTLWIRSSDLIVTHLVVVDLNDVTMTFDLTQIEVNPELEDDTFSFDIPDGTEIIDLRN